MRPEGVPIQRLILRTFLPAVILVAIVLAAIVYNRLYATILDGFDRKLVTTSALTGALIDPADHDWLIRKAKAAPDAAELEKSPPYLRNVQPMRRIRERLGLTYLYTQIPGGPQDILYILDASFGRDHSAIGSPDSLPAETVAGLRRTMRDGFVYISPIEYQAQWGLLKTAAAPLRDASGRIVATAGADVNISVIQIATQNALFLSAVIGIGSIIACALVALAIVRLVARPIEKLRGEALRIAGGDPAPPMPIRHPREVSALRDSLAAMAAKMAETHAAARQTAAGHEQRETRRLLGRALRRGDAGRPVMLVDTADRRVLWFPERGGDEHIAAFHRLGMEALAERIRADSGLAEHWRTLAVRTRGAFLVVDRARASLAVEGVMPLALLAGGREISLDPGESLPLEEGIAVRLPDGVIVPLHGETAG